MLDPRPYAWLAQHAPDKLAMVDQAAAQAGVSPQRLAYHWYAEGRFNTDVPDGKSGEVGPGQVMPETASRFDNDGRLNIRDPRDNLQISANYIRYLDNQYGRDSVSSVAGYQGGEGSVNDIAAHPNQAWQNHPKTMKYAQNAFAGSQVGPQQFTGGGNMTPRGLVQAGVNGGPDGFISYAVNSAPSGMPLTDVWQHAEGMLTRAFLEKGDIAGAQHARDYVLQMSHAGSNQNLMAAHQALMTGDSVGAANYLAKAHAFFPDGTIGRFSVDGKGNIWADRLDEHDPTRPLGKPFQVTPDGIAGMLNQTTDPAKYLQTVMAEQKNAADIRHQNAMGDYYSNLLSSRESIAADRNATTTTNAEIRGGAQVTAAEVRAAARAGQGPAASLSKAADTETAKLYGPDAMPNAPMMQRQQMADLHHDARLNGANPITAETVARGLSDRTLQLLRGTDGRYGVVNPKGPQQPIAYISKDLGDRLAGAAAPGASPVGAGAGSMYARGAGVGQDLTGTTQSSAVPTSAGR